MKPSSLLCTVLVVTLGLFIMAQFSRTRSYSPSMGGGSPGIRGGAARLPCLANNHCPMGQKCTSGFCSEGFITPPSQIADMSSCTAKECNGLNAPCARKGVPCPEGTFCQGNNCIRIAAPDQGAAYNQIGMLLD
jgi:hypothetical protein